MAGAILAGLLQPGVVVEGGIRATNRSAAKAAELRRLQGVTAFATENDPEANRAAVARCGDRGRRRQAAPWCPICSREIADALEPGALVVSVAAGVTIATFESLLPASVAVIRSMPNTPAVVGRAVTGLSAGTRSSDERPGARRRPVRDRRRGARGARVADRRAPHDLGLGPRLRLLPDRAAHGARRSRKGFTPEQAALMVQGTFRGASELLAASGEDPAELRRRVTSPKGTTERAIAVLRGGRPPALFGGRREPRSPAPAKLAGRASRSASREGGEALEVARSVPETMMRSWFETTVSAVA